MNNLSMLPRWFARLRGLMTTRVKCSRIVVSAFEEIQIVRNEMRVNASAKTESDQRARNAELELSSARVVIEERDREVDRLKQEAAQKDATIAVREHEIEELNLWLERVRKRLDADIAQEIAREYRAVAPNRPAASAVSVS